MARQKQTVKSLSPQMKPLIFSAVIVKQGNGGRINLPKALIGRSAVIVVYVDEELVSAT